MPQNWKTYKLSDVAIIKYGKDHKKLDEGLIPCYGTGGIMRYVDKCLSKEESVLIPRKGSLNNIYYINKPFWTVDTLFWTQVDSSKILPKYLYYNFKTLDFASKDVGSAVPSLTTSLLNEIKITIPELKEQKAIASILSALDDKIELNLQMNKTLEEMAMALYKHWFVDFGPFKEGEFIDSELGKIPKGWEVKKFDDFIDKIIDNRGKTPPLSKEKTEYLLFETYQLTREKLFPDSFQNNKAKYVTKDIYNDKKWFRKGHPQYLDILFATVGNGIPNWSFMYENNGVGIAQNVVGIRPKKEIPSIFLRCAFESKSFLQQFEGYVIRTAQPSIKLSDLSRIDIISAPNEIIKSWSNIVTPLVEQVYSQYKETQTLTQLRNTLLPQLISGKIRVKEAAKTISAVL